MFLKAYIKDCDSVLTFSKSIDGWWINTEYNLAINEAKTVCVTDKWYSDYLCEAPTHEFKVIDNTEMIA